MDEERKFSCSKTLYIHRKLSLEVFRRSYAMCDLGEVLVWTDTSSNNALSITIGLFPLEPKTNTYKTPIRH